MGKTLVINMDYLELKGDILDISEENAGVIYSISKDIEEELSVDYVDESNKQVLKGREYSACTLFFNLNKLWGNRKKEALVKDVTKYIKKEGKIFLWDINKEVGQKIFNKVNFICPNGTVRSGTVKNNNLLSCCSFEETIKIVEKYYIIEETKVWQEMFFIKGRKK